MFNILKSQKHRFRSNFERERMMERPLETIAKKLWPWPDSKLLLLVILFAVLDYISTYAFLTYGNPQAVEGGLLAGWALQTGGFPKLLFVDAIAVGLLVLLALSLRSLYTILGFRGLGRVAFVFLLLPYFTVIIAVVYNNIFWALF